MDKRRVVLNAFPKDGSGIRYTQLFKKIQATEEGKGMSNSTLTNCLKQLEYMGWVESKVLENHGRGRKGVEYALTPVECDYLNNDKLIENTVQLMKKSYEAGTQVESQIPSYDGGQMIMFPDQLKRAELFLLGALLKYSLDSKEDKEGALKRFDNFMSVCFIPHIHSVLKLVESPYTLTPSTLDVTCAALNIPPEALKVMLEMLSSVSPSSSL